MFEKASRSQLASDYLLTALFLIPGLVFGVLTVFSCWYSLPACLAELSREPLEGLAIYLWFKAIAFDILRIRRNQAVTMPMMVYFTNGLIFFYYWEFYEFNQTRQIIENPNYWLSVEIVTGLLMLPVSKYLSGTGNRADRILILDLLRTLALSFAIFIIGWLVNTLALT